MYIQLPIRVPENLKSRVLSTRALARAWGAFRRWELYRDFGARRDLYAAMAKEEGLCYRESEIVAAIRRRLANRGYHPARRAMGEIHTFAFIPGISWHDDLIPDLRLLGPLTRFDYTALGVQAREIHCGGRVGIARRKWVNELILPALREAHARRPVDWVFVYASGLEISAGVIRQIVEELGIPAVNMCLDDKNSWDGRYMGDHRSGQVDIAAAFDLSWTSARVACEWYLALGARPIYMPEGFDASKCRPHAPPDIPISFVGAAYGFRPDVIHFLRRHSVPVHTYGVGWPDSRCANHPTEIASRSLINLGMGGIGFAENLTNVKARDFEIPATACGAYLTTFNADLAQHFDIGKEILCYQSREEMLDLIRHYLKHPEESMLVAGRGRKRCLLQHRWLHRYQRVCESLGILNVPEHSQGSIAELERVATCT